MSKHFSKMTNMQHTHKKMFNITNHQGNANKTTIRYNLRPIKMSTIKTRKKERKAGVKKQGPYALLIT